VKTPTAVFPIVEMLYLYTNEGIKSWGCLPGRKKKLE
jgi:hypothetical protein